MSLRLIASLVVVLLISGSGCAKRRCEAARVEALPEWQRLQTEIDRRLGDARTVLEQADAGAGADSDSDAKRARNRFELINFWSTNMHALTNSLAAAVDEGFQPTFASTVRELSESVHGVNDPALNDLLTPARRTAMNVVAACQK